MSELPEKVIVSNGCHDCYFAHHNFDYNRKCLIKEFPIYIYKHSENETRHPQCPLNTHSIKVVKSD